jgi:hypothetical protein
VKQDLDARIIEMKRQERDAAASNPRSRQSIQSIAR